MKVVLCTSHFDPDRGGIVTVVREHARGLASQGHDVTVVVLGDTTGRGDEVTGDGVHVLRRPDPRAGKVGGRVSGLRRTWRLLQGAWDQADIIHVHGYHTLFGQQMVRLARRSAPHAKVVWSTHYHGHGHGRITRLVWPIFDALAGRSLHRAHAVVCVSDYEARLLAKRHAGLQSITVIPNGVERIQPRRRAARRGPALHFLYVGFLEPYKGVQHVLAGLASYRREGHNARLTVVGRGSAAQDLQAQAAQLGLEDHIAWLSEVSSKELQRHYREHDALLLLSEAEAYGLVVAEAMATGTPCIVRDTSALSEFARLTGCLGIPGELDGAKVAAAMAHTPTKVNLADQEKVVTWSYVANRLADLYAGLLSGDGDMNRTAA